MATRVVARRSPGPTAWLLETATPRCAGVASVTNGLSSAAIKNFSKRGYSFESQRGTSHLTDYSLPSGRRDAFHAADDDISNYPASRDCAGRCRRRLSDRGTQSRGDRATNRILCEHAAAAHEFERQSKLPPTAGQSHGDCAG